MVVGRWDNCGFRTMRRIVFAGLSAIGFGHAAWAGLDSGVAAYDSGNYPRAYSELRGLADTGNPVAAYVLGRMYIAGQGVPRDSAEGMKWLRLAAEHGEPNAEIQLAARYEAGVGVPQSDEEAFLWYRKAAGRGSAVAQLHVGVMYAGGRGVAQDRVKAHVWLNLATASLPPGEIRNSAAWLRDSITVQLTPAQVVEAHRQARDWKPSASN